MRRCGFVFTFLAVFVLISCSSIKHKDVPYLNAEVINTSVSNNISAPTLDIYEPKGEITNRPVLIFVHGGNWNSGKKEIYWWLGRNFARKDVLTIIPSYTVSPKANYNDQATQIAAAIKWVKKNASKYGGNPSKIFISGHSAGGHLAALSVLNPKYNIPLNDISGIVLIDAAGLDMAHYLERNPPKSNNNYDTTWTKDPQLWKDASPIYFLNENTPPILSYLGKKTYPSITVANERFQSQLKKFHPSTQLIELDKKHIPMVTQFILGSNNRYDEMLQFFNNN